MDKKEQFLSIGILLTFLLVVNSSLLAQGGGSSGVGDPISAGMANSYITTSRGVYAIHKNPANLVLSTDNHFEFATVLPIPNVNIFTGTDFITMGEYNFFFGGVEDANGETVPRYLDENEKNRLMSLFEEGGTGAFDVSTTYFSVVYNVNPEVGAFGFSFSDNASLFFDFPESIIDLALMGNERGKVFNFEDSKLNMSWLRDYSLTYAREFTKLFKGSFKLFSAGITLKYIQGFAYVEIDHINTTLSTGQRNEIISNGDMLAYSAFSNDFGVEYDFDSTGNKSESDFSFFPSPAGTGFGFDIGFTAQVDDIWTIGLSITDIGSVNWTENVAEYSSKQALFIEDLTDEESRDSILNTVTGDGKFVNEITSSLPTALRLGASFQFDKAPFIEDFPGTLLLTLDYNQGFNNAPRNSTKPRFSIGAEWRPADVVPIRTGFSFGGRDGFGWALGTGVDLGLFEFNISAANFANWLKANESEKFTVSIGSRWKF